MLLAIYLRDHAAGAMAGRDLARRAARGNRSSTYGSFLSELAEQIEQDRQSLLEIMRALEVRPDPVKELAAWGVEKLGRLKLNGRVLKYSPLSRVVELEGLITGVRGKLALWRSLESIAGSRPALASFDLGVLATRAEHQLEELERHRIRAVHEAFV